MKCWAATLVAAAVVGCAAQMTIPPSPVDAPIATGLAVALRWEAAVDLDLYVTDPSGETFYYANRGAVLAAETRCTRAPSGQREERARWTQPPPGRYRVGVDFPDACGGRTAEAAFRVVVDHRGDRREVVGRAYRNERQPAVTEFEVPR